MLAVAAAAVASAGSPGRGRCGGRGSQHSRRRCHASENNVSEKPDARSYRKLKSDSMSG